MWWVGPGGLEAPDPDLNALRRKGQTMSDKYQTALRLQLLALGYEPIPNVGKVPALSGWNAPDYLKRELTKYGNAHEIIQSWERRFPQALSTGVRLTKRLGSIDADIDEERLADAFWDCLEQVAPDVAERAPRRFGGGTHKVALFVQVEGEQWVRLSSRSYGGHRVEIFGGALLPSGRASRQFGVAGPHSEGTTYLFAEGVPALDVTSLHDLVRLTRAQAAALIDAFDAAAVRLGFAADERHDETGTAEEAFDIAPDAVFAVDDGEAATYDDLAGLIGRRCASSFIPGDSGHNRTKCWIFWSARYDCVGVYDFETTVRHYPAALAPIDPAAFGAKLAEVAALHNVALPAELPNWRERTKGGVRPAPSLHNACLAIESAGLTCSHDVFHNKMFIGRGETAAPSDPLPRHCGEVTDGRVMALRGHLSARYGFDLQDKHVRDAIMLLAGTNQFNPVTDMLAEAEANWDGVLRLDRLACDFFGCADTPLNRAMARKTMIAAVARARVPGCKFDTILVLESPEGWNKSTAWAVLAGEGNFSDERIIGKDSREVVEQLSGIWIHENADLAGMKKTEVETVKAYASRTIDRARPAYAHYVTDQPRHSIEVGTTNNDEYLQSQTGNRRFWPMRLTRRIDLGQLRAARLQLWGEAAHYQSGGEALTLPEELWGDAAVEQEARRVRDAWEDALAERLTVVAMATGPLAGVGRVMGVVQVVGDEERVAAKTIFETILGLPTHMLHDQHTKRLANAMRALGWSRGQFRIGADRVRGYYRKVKGT